MESLMKKILFIIAGTPYPITSGRQIRTHNFVQALAQNSELYLLYQKWGGDEQDDTSNFLEYFKKAQKFSFNRVQTDKRGSLSKIFIRRCKLLYSLLSFTSWQFNDIIQILSEQFLI